MGGYFKTNAVIAICVIICLRRSTFGQGSFCKNTPSSPGSPLPSLPKHYSTNIRVNDKTREASAEIVRIVDSTIGSDSIEYWNGTTHVKYIAAKKDNAFLRLKYDGNDITCQKSDLSETNRRSIFESDGLRILQIIDVVESQILPQTKEFKDSSATIIGSIAGMTWVFCNYVKELDAEIRVTAFFSTRQWKPSYPGKKMAEQEIEQVVIEGIGSSSNEDIIMTLDYYNYRPFQPKEADFQVPELVYCKNYRNKRELPSISKYFSYQSEKLEYGSGNALTISHREVNYDTTAGFGRLSYENTDEKEKYSRSMISTIYDFNLGIQYTKYSQNGRCEMAVFNKTFDVMSEVQTPTNSILDPDQFFLLSGQDVSYNGKYETRGIPAEVYSASVIKDRERLLCFWYFTTDRTKIIQSQVMEKQMLTKMITIPLSTDGRPIKSHLTEWNFYNFDQSQPIYSTFDIAPCYNESQSKAFVITFPGRSNVFAKESKPTLEMVIHRKIQEMAGVGRQRVIINQFYAQEDHLFVQFMLLGLPPIRGHKPAPNENDLDAAIVKLQKAISEGIFKVSFTTNASLEIILEPEPDGLREFKGEQNLQNQRHTYNEGSVVGMAVGMTVLGFLLGAVVVNLIISKKYGVSLLQKAGFVGSGARAFDNPLNESSM